jgi:hypothetical protein
LRDALEWGVALARTLEERQNSVRFGVSRNFGRQPRYMVELKLDVN